MTMYYYEGYLHSFSGGIPQDCIYEGNQQLEWLDGFMDCINDKGLLVYASLQNIL
jgi:hypothetical protein